MDLMLIGLRGSGKSTLGRRVAAERGLRFVDLDERTPAYLGATTVAEAWLKHGEPSFRAAEIRALQAAIDENPHVLALGGGTPLAPGARELIEQLKQREGERTLLVYLRAPAAALRSRLTGAMSGRPSLTGADPLGEIDAVLAMRDPLYRELADRVVEVGEMDESKAARALAELLPVH
jgi:shikimate kinase